MERRGEKGRGGKGRGEWSGVERGVERRGGEGSGVEQARGFVVAAQADKRSCISAVPFQCGAWGPSGCHLIISLFN